ncbi:MAG: DUF4124 domain-containing protein [Desulfamplus sp.]|nr:DUF4124 domain-containing protein [Desulfamplus sp.]
MLRTVLLMGILLITTPVFGEYYQYIGADGTVHYTDDLSAIPREHIVSTFESIKSEPHNKKISETEIMDILEKTEETDETETDQGNADALYAMRKELNKIFDEIEAEKVAIGQPPPESADASVKKEYNDKVLTLNQKIDVYQLRVDAFEKKVKEFNNRISEK